MNHGIADRIVAFRAASLVVLGTASGCGDSATEPPSSTPDPPRPTTVMVNPATAELAALGATVQLTAEVRDQNNRVMAGATVTWSSGDASVATVGAAGLVTAVANGTATITAASGGTSGTAAVTVAQALDSVAVSPTEATIAALGDTVRLAAQAFDGNGHAVAGAEFSWEASDASVATVSASGLVTAAGNGTATITATAGSASGSAAVAVAQEVSAVAVTPAADTVVAGDTLRLAAEAADANGHPVAGSGFHWASADTLVAVVDDAGLVTGVGAGEAEVTAMAVGITGRAVLTVVAPVPTVVAVTPDTLALAALGETAQLDAEVHDQIGRVMEGVRVSWSSADTLVAAVDSAGLVTAVGSGAATITARAGEAAGYALVTVMQSAGSVVVSPPAATVALGDTLRLAAEAFDANGHLIEGVEFAWSSSDGSVAMVDATGLVRGVAEGAATITANSGSASGSSEITVENPDRAVLVALYEATGGRSWTRRDNWLSDEPLGEWHGVGVDSLGRVTSLNLGGNELSGPIPTELAGLANLRSLWLNDNDLTGPIPPALGRLTELESLSLWGNELSGTIPTELGGLANLRSLWLSSNDLTGTIPPELGQLIQLEGLDLGGNGLTGPITTELGGLTRLESLSLGWNELSGTIPTELGGLTNLKSLWLPVNELTGPIPTELGQLTRLESLNLGGNRLSGPIPRSLLQLDRLRDFRIGGNESRPNEAQSLCIPGIPAFDAWLQGLENWDGPVFVLCNAIDLEVLRSLFERVGGERWTRSDGWLADHAPGEWYGVTADSLGRVTALDLARNGLDGRLPANMAALDAMTVLRIGDNALSGPLPLGMKQLTLRQFQYTDTELCIPEDETLRMWLNAIASHEGTGRDCGATYPIHIEWWYCEWQKPETCEEVDPDAVMPPLFVDGIRSSTAEWATVLAPTPAAPAVAERSFNCFGGPHIPAGTELPPGTTIQVVVTDEDKDAAGGYPCYFEQSETGVPTLVAGQYYTLQALARDDRSPWSWYQLGLHESGHGFQDWDRWRKSMVVSADSTRAWLADSAWIATFDAMGGADFPGEKVLTDWPWCEGCHWHYCTASPDIMSSIPHPAKEITNLTLAALPPGFRAVPQLNRLWTDYWDECPGPGQTSGIAPSPPWMEIEEMITPGDPGSPLRDRRRPFVPHLR